MQLKSITANLLTDDMAGTVSFYQEKLGFSLQASVPETPPFGWIMLERDGLLVMVQSRESLGEDLGLFKEADIAATLVFFCKVKDFDGWWESLAYKVEVFMPPRTTFYGMREFGFLDNNGYQYVFAEEVAG
jgi:uncharacterized glyoxalase superfamily protein PhnB